MAKKVTRIEIDLIKIQKKVGEVRAISKSLANGEGLGRGEKLLWSILIKGKPIHQKIRELDNFVYVVENAINKWESDKTEDVNFEEA